MMGANPEKEYKTMFENGTFAVLGPDGKQVQCDVLFTYDCEDRCISRKLRQKARDDP